METGSRAAQGVNLREALAVADMRLYQAKQAGRNRVVTAPRP